MVLFRVSWGVPGLEWEQAGSTGKHVGLEKSRNTITDRYGKLSYEYVIYIYTLNYHFGEVHPSGQSFLRQGSALWEAASHGHLEIATMLLIRGAQPYLTNTEGLTPVDIARKNKRRRVLLKTVGQL